MRASHVSNGANAQKINPKKWQKGKLIWKRRAKNSLKRGQRIPSLKFGNIRCASFSDLKTDFSKWNLYASLGLDPKEPDGLGSLIYAYVDEKFQMANGEQEKTAKLAEGAYHELKHMEHLVKNAQGSDGRRMQAQYQASSHHYYACLNLRDQHYKRAVHYSQFFSFLMKAYDEKFHEFFQEIYDER